MRAVLGLDQELLTGETVGEVTDRIYEIWEQNTSGQLFAVSLLARKWNKADIPDPVITAIIEELFESLSTRPHLILTIISHLSPRLSTLISTPTDDETIHVPGEAVQLANSLIRARGGPIEAELVRGVTGAVLSVLAGTDDMDVIQVWFFPLREEEGKKS